MTERTSDDELRAVINTSMTLLDGWHWYVSDNGQAAVWKGMGMRYESYIKDNPAEALTSAWLKATT